MKITTSISIAILLSACSHSYLPSQTGGNVNETSEAASQAAKSEELSNLVSPVTTNSESARKAFSEARVLDVPSSPAADIVAGYDKVIALDPSFAQAYMFRGRILLRSDKAKGNSDLSTAMELATTLPEIEKLWIEAFVLSLGTDREAARTALEQVVSLAPRDIMILEWIQHTARVWKEPELLVSTTQKLVELEPDSPQRWNVLAYTLAEAKRFKQALRAGLKVISLNPSDANGYDSIGEIYLKMGELAEAEQAFSQSIEMAPNVVYAYEGKAAIAIHQGDPERALSILITAKQHMKDQEGRVRIQDAISQVYLASGDMEASVKSMEEHLVMPRTDAMWALNPHIQRAKWAILSEDWPRAIVEARKAATHSSIQKWPHWRYYALAIEVNAQVQLGHKAKAEKVLSILEMHKVDNPTAYHQAQFHVSLSKKDFSGALSHMRSISRRFQQMPLQLELIRSLRASGEDIEVFEQCKEMLADYPRHIYSAVVRSLSNCNPVKPILGFFRNKQINR